jgi:protein translocase SecG subunit
MQILIVILTIVLVIDSLFLGLLILIQLPKKEAGIGVAFGGGAADALFGAGSGTALSSLTKYSAIAFFVLVFSISVLNTRSQHSNISDLKSALRSQASQPVTAPAGNATPAAAPTAIPSVPQSGTMSSNTIVAPSTTSISNAAAPGK